MGELVAVALWWKWRSTSVDGRSWGKVGQIWEVETFNYLNILKIFVTSKNFITTQNIGIGYLVVRSENILQIMIFNGRSWGKVGKIWEMETFNNLNILKIFGWFENFINTQNIEIGYLVVKSETILQIMILMAEYEAKLDKIGVGIFWNI